MNENRLERLSSFIDGEETDQEALISEAIEKEETRTAWDRYHLIGETLRGNLSSHLDRGFCRKVAEAVAKEPALPPGETPRFMLKAKPVIGLALAASILGIIVAAVYQPEETAQPQTDIAAAGSMDLPALDESFPRHNFQQAYYLVGHDQYGRYARVTMVPGFVRIATINAQ